MKDTALGEGLVTNIARGELLYFTPIKYSTQLRLVLYLPLDSHLELYISYKLAAVL